MPTAKPTTNFLKGLSRTPRLSISQVMALPEYLQLTMKQRCFVMKWIGSGDATLAASLSYATKHAAILGAELLRQTKIRRVLDLWARRSDLDQILDNLRRASKKAARKRELTPEVEKALLAFAELVEKDKAHASQP